jgi:hypothetical protein
VIKHSPADDSDRGSISLFVVVIAIVLFAAIGLVVDGAGKVRAIQHADNAAQEAARAAGQQLEIPNAVRGGAPVLDTEAAAIAARAYLSSAAVQGTVSVSGTTITVDTSTVYKPVFSQLIGVGPMTVTGHATARTVRGITGEDG